MRLLVTGKDGQLARGLAESVASRPDVAFVAASRPELDLEVPGSAWEFISRLAPDVVINAAAYTDVDGAEEQPLRALRINAEAAGEVAAAAAAVGAPIIHISTDYVFDGSATRPYAEEAPTGPINAYGRSKFAGEEAVRSANSAHLILPTAWVYSPFGRNFVKTMFQAAEDREEIRVITDNRGSPTSALDLADALLKVVREWSGNQSGVYHLAGSGDASWFELADAVMKCRARLELRTARLVPIGTSEWPMRAVRPSFSELSDVKFTRDFGFALPHWQASVARVVARLAGGPDKRLGHQPWR